MAVYVDRLQWHGKRQWCHMATDGEREELHAMAARIGLKRCWFQGGRHPHYDLTPTKRHMAIEQGVVAVGMVELFKTCFR